VRYSADAARDSVRCPRVRDRAGEGSERIRGAVPEQHRSDSLSAAFRNLDAETAVFLGMGYSTGRARAGIVLFLALLAATMELAQYWIPGRHSQLIDFVAGSVGASLGIIVLAVIDRLRDGFLVPRN
jgi:VanZ family protein